MFDKPQLDLLFEKMNNIERVSYFNNYKTDDTYALNLLQSLLIGYPFLPFTGSSLRPFCLAHIINDVLINSRKQLIEFGSGISTILIGRLIVKNKLDAKLLSIEHDKEWWEFLTRTLKSENLDNVVNVIYAPLQSSAITTNENMWYDLALLEKQTKNRMFDMVIIDGPPAWEHTKQTARYPAVPFLSNKLAANFSIYLDDAIRKGEQEIIRAWESTYNIKFTITGRSLAYYYGGKAFFTEPFSFY